MNQKEKKFRNLPAFLTLLSGFITSVIAIVCKFDLVRMLWTLVVIMVIFFVIGLIIRYILDKALVIPEPEEEKKEGEEENKEGLAEGDSQAAEGSKEPKEPKAK